MVEVKMRWNDAILGKELSRKLLNFYDPSGNLTSDGKRATSPRRLESAEQANKKNKKTDEERVIGV